MPTSEKQRRAAFAELRKRKQGHHGMAFKGMTMAELESYAHSPLHRK